MWWGIANDSKQNFQLQNTRNPEAGLQEVVYFGKTTNMIIRSDNIFTIEVN